MIVTCSSIFLTIFIICIVIFVLSSRKGNCIILISGCLSILISVLFYLLMYYQIISINFIKEKIIYFFIEKLKFNIDLAYRRQFIEAFIIVIIHMIFFLLFFMISFNIGKHFNCNKKNRLYYVQKYILVGFNILISGLLISFIISTINLAYNINDGFLSFVFDMVRKGILAL